ncbi:MAG: hypothetical protein NZ959_05100 [Armatimonadetes bacterium]|nr:hypothetical protein [Armatimonadota bacterium]MDW8121958.1 hypothetical protein [Armatimonadota bacterium]
MRRCPFFWCLPLAFCGLLLCQVVSDQLDPEEPQGQRPYEMVWANRKEPRPPTVTFSNLTGWKVTVTGGAVATLSVSRGENVWDRLVGKLTYRGNGDPNTQHLIRIEPPEPVPISDESDCVDMWVYGNRWDWENPPDTPPVFLYLEIVDRRGQKQRVLVHHVYWKTWWLCHRRIPAGSGRKWTALEVEGGWQKDDRTLYFDSITFYREPLPPLSFPARPKRNLTLFPGQSAGLNTGKGRLPFPTREETILPVNLEQSFRCSAEKRNGLVVFTYEGMETKNRLEYRIDPADLKAGVEVGWGKRTLGRLLIDGLVRGADGSQPSSPQRHWLRDGVLTVQFGQGARYLFRLWQKSLVVDVQWQQDASGSRPEGVEVSFGWIRFDGKPRTVYIPFITYGASNPVVLMVQDALPNGPVFVSQWLDWYRSNGSEPYAFSNGEITELGVRINGGVRYHPKTDGKRNDIYERFFITVSTEFEEVLPVIPNPKGLNAEKAVDRLWQESWGPADYQQEMKRSRLLRAYGIERLIQCNHEITWRDGGESFTLRLRAAPGKGGDQALIEYLKHQKSLGWYAGLYTNYTDFAPVNEHWNPDFVQRTSDGNWRHAWARCWALKPAAAVVFDFLLAPQIKKKFHPDSTNVSGYTDVHTAVPPWVYCDYDARVPGAGTFAQTFYCYGELLRNDSKVYGGPIFSEGTFQWLYAGLCDGNYALTYNGRPIAREPLLPVFFLREIHTKECDIGMAWTDWFLQGIPDWQKDIDQALDRFLLHTIAYGTLGWLIEERFGMERVVRSYYLLQRLQARYGLQPPESIRYWNGNRLVSVSQALYADLPTTRRQMLITYKNGLKVWINDYPVSPGEKPPPESLWTVKVRGREWVIPPAGWLAEMDGFFTYSALIDDRKVDYLEDLKGWKDQPPLLFADGRGQETDFGTLRTVGGVALRRLSKDRLEVMDALGKGQFGLKNPFGMKGKPVRCLAFSADDRFLGEIPIDERDGFISPKPVSGALRYVVHYR